MKNILLLVHDDAGQEARLQVALDLTRALRGHLTCVDIVPLYYQEDGMCGGAFAVILADGQAVEDVIRARLKARLTAEDVTWNWIDRIGDLAGCVTRAAGLADLIVGNRRLGNDALDMARIAASIAIDTHKPIVAVPDTVRRFDATGRALVPWDGSLPAMTALSASMPLLALAQSVRLLEIDIAAGRGSGRRGRTIPVAPRHPRRNLSHRGGRRHGRHNDSPTYDRIRRGVLRHGRIRPLAHRRGSVRRRDEANAAGLRNPARPRPLISSNS